MIEILLSVLLITLLAGLSIPVYTRFQTKNDLSVMTSTVAQSLRRAQALSQAVDSDSSWGIYVESGNVIIFQGDSYLSRDPDFDEVFNFPSSITPSGLSEIVFDKYSGEPQNTGTLTLTSVSTDFKTLTINEKGIIFY